VKSNPYVIFAAASVAILFGVLIAFSLGAFQGQPGVVASARATGSSAGPSAAWRTSTPRTPTPSERVEELSLSALRLTEENRKLQAKNRDLQERLVAVLNWILANFRGKYPLGENYMSNLAVSAVADDYTLHPEAAEFYKVSPAEAQKLNDALAYARQYLAEIEAATMTVTSPRPDKVVLHIPPFPEDGKVLQEDLYSAFEITLGSDRFERFLKTSENSLKSNFYQFGDASRTMVFELAYPADGSAPQLKIKDGWVLEVGPNIRSVTATESVVTNLPGKYSPYLAWLPDYVAAYQTP
jgi:hypothetical protein